MALETPPLATVEPGRPITAQGWNDLVTGLLALYEAVKAFGSGLITVSVQADGQVVRDAQIVAEPVLGGQPVRGLPLFGSRDAYLVTGVSDGAWRVHVIAPGFVTQVLDATVPLAAPLTVNLVRSGVAVPDLFGTGYATALATLSSLGLQTEIAIDTTGEEISRAQVPAEFQNQPILVQLPVPGTVVDPAVTRLRLVVATADREEPVVTVPSLIGLTQAEAARALERIGLRLGKIVVRG